MRHVIIASLIALYSVGCSSIPFKSVTCVSLEAVDPATTREQFALSLPSNFQLVNTISFQYRHKSLSAIGYSAVDTEKKSFSVTAVNPMGITLFALTGDADHAEFNFVLAEFNRQADFAGAIADDIRRIYFDLVPAPKAEVQKRKYEIVFRQPSARGSLEYIFAGADNVLIEKHYYEKKRRVWSVFYYEYLQKNEKLYPAGIILKHHKYKYKLILRLKEIR